MILLLRKVRSDREVGAVLGALALDPRVPGSQIVVSGVEAAEATSSGLAALSR